jgi:hypothetical protein
MTNLTCPECNAPLSQAEVKAKCQSSVHLFKLTLEDTNTQPEAVVIQCPNGHFVEVDCSEANQDHA